MAGFERTTLAKILGSSSEGEVYIYGNEDTDESLRINRHNNIFIFERRIDGLWQPTSIETGANSFWAGHNVGVAGVGHHLATEASDGHMHFHAHSEFDGNISTTDAQVLYSYASYDNYPFQPDDSGEWTGTVFEFSRVATLHSLVKRSSFKIGNTGATKPLRFRVWDGADDTGSLIFDQTYAAHLFPANTTVEIELGGALEFIQGTSNFFRYESEKPYSLKTDAEGNEPWFETDISLVREENILQTMPYMDGDTYTMGQLLIQDRQIYVCNTEGIQIGDFASNSDKWDLLNSGDSHEHTETDPIFTTWNKSTGISITENQISDLQSYLLAETDPVFLSQKGVLNGVATLDGSGKIPASQLPSSVMEYQGTWNASTNTPTLVDGTGDLGDIYKCNVAGTHNFGSGNIAFNISDWVIYNGSMWERSPNSDVETDPIFTAWDKSSGIGITESQISDLNHFNGMFGALSGTTQNRVPYGNASGGLIDSPNLTYFDGALRVSNGGLYLDRLGADSYLAFKRSGTQVGQIRGADGSIDITASGGSPVYLSVDTNTGVTSIDDVNTSKIGNSSGILKLNPDATGIVELFGDTDVGNDENGKMLYIWRRAPEGDHYIRLYVGDDTTGVISAGADLTVYAVDSVTLQSDMKDVIFRMGDNAGAKGTYFKNNSNAIVGSVDSLGNAQFNVSIDVPEISNTAGLLKIQPDVQGNVELFGDTDVGNGENSKMLYVRRQAGEGNDYIRFYISANRTAYIHSSNNLTLQAQVPFTINSVTDDINLKVGDNAGNKKVYFKDSDGSVVAAVDSNGNLTLGGTVDGVDIAALDTKVDTKAPQDSALLTGDLEIRDGIRFHDSSTQNEAAERDFSLGHTHTAIPNGFYDSSAENISERGIAFSSDGETMYISGISNNGVGDGMIWEYPLTVPWDLSTVGIPTTKSVEIYSSNPTGICFSPDGRTMYICDATEDIVSRWTSILPWNLATFNYVEELDVSSEETSPAGIDISPNGKKLFIIGTGSDAVRLYVLNNAWELGSVIPSTSFGTSIDNPTCVRFNSDGRRMYVMDGSAEDDIHEYHLATPWSIGTAVLENLYDVSAQNASPQGIFLKPDNSTIYMVGTSTPEGVYAYDLGLEVGGSIVTNNGAIQTGSMTTTQRDALVAVNGMIIYNTITNVFNFRENGNWINKN